MPASPYTSSSFAPSADRGAVHGPPDQGSPALVGHERCVPGSGERTPDAYAGGYRGSDALVTEIAKGLPGEGLEQPHLCRSELHSPVAQAFRRWSPEVLVLFGKRL